ncbi:YbgA family protein [Brevibacillus dissolubilis]|uniref:YbgA family protein n=1 Tax=Brevibacillus dissolubilis TaxID=1844116 RepID=UPI001115BA1A|nr:DUF523 and DUF1722 domain-containing protein [Brevibacillus dissolubilis]
MREFQKPVIVVSKCLQFDACRYNGEMLNDPVVESLLPYVTFVPICPEVEIGLGTPRETIRIVKDGEQNRLMQPSTGADVSDAMNRFTDAFIQALGEVDGFILKNRSPSCGVKDVKIYSGLEKAPVIETGGGFFGGKIFETFSHLAVEEEGRLKNFLIREHFFTKLFTLAQFRQIKKTASMRELVKFHSDNKYLLMSYNQSELKRLGNIVANHEKLPIQDVYEQYEKGLYHALRRSPRQPTNINTLTHIMGYFSKELSSNEKTYFLELLEKYRNRKAPLSSPLGVLRSWVIRFEHDYLRDQTIFNPYPEALVEITDSGKGRDY